MSADCWVCGGRGGSQAILRPDGAADGRRVCRVCTRRLVAWLGALPPEGRQASLSAIWPAVGQPEPDAADPDAAAARAAFLESAAAALPAADDPTRAGVALGLLELGFTSRALEVLSGADPATVEALGDRPLTSLLSRLLHPDELAPEAREALDGALYPGPALP